VNIVAHACNPELQDKAGRTENLKPSRAAERERARERERERERE
jgi:hypothetical protein